MRRMGSLFFGWLLLFYVSFSKVSDIYWLYSSWLNILTCCQESMLCATRVLWLATLTLRLVRTPRRCLTIRGISAHFRRKLGPNQRPSVNEFSTLYHLHFQGLRYIIAPRRAEEEERFTCITLLHLGPYFSITISSLANILQILKICVLELITIITFTSKTDKMMYILTLGIDPAPPPPIFRKPSSVKYLHLLICRMAYRRKTLISWWPPCNFIDSFSGRQISLQTAPDKLY